MVALEGGIGVVVDCRVGGVFGGGLQVGSEGELATGSEKVIAGT